jgi:hypothetical protein
MKQFLSDKLDDPILKAVVFCLEYRHYVKAIYYRENHSISR